MNNTDTKEDSSLDEFVGRLQLKRHSVSDLVSEISPQIYTNLRSAIELSKWPDGRLLNKDQKESCIKLVILYEAGHIPETERVGFNLPVGCSKGSDKKDTEVLRILDRETDCSLSAESESNSEENEL
ncbi:MAG TPA: DUF1315 family protein [Porticoccaceae bacterium]|jgi:uncharacterized protein YeaC (DUF1315 family)|nr:DUF1315 family protein [Gammaproteobacteria bacterium]HIL60566.1 DUF1315 family protein [Porticoccaceae bacterium]